MKVGNLVRNHLNKKIGIVTEITSDSDAERWPLLSTVWVRWIGNTDWDLHWPEDLEILNESR